MQEKLIPQPGDFGLTKIKGWTGVWVSLGQWLNGDASRFTHAFLVLDNEQVIEAQPGGAVITPLSEYLGRLDVVFSRRDLTDEQRDTMVAHARQLEGTPYSFLDYLAIGLARLGITPSFIMKRVLDSGHLICSQLVAGEYERVGAPLFTDGTLPSMVTPGDLTYVLTDSK
jgi:uncharacterized protein YycO